MAKWLVGKETTMDRRELRQWEKDPEDISDTFKDAPAVYKPKTLGEQNGLRE